MKKEIQNQTSELSLSPREKKKQLTKAKLIRAVGEILQKEGYSGLGLSKTAQLAQVSKGMIYKYFGSFDKLVEDYVLEKDYWKLSAKSIQGEAKAAVDLEARINSDLANQFDLFFKEAEMQQLIIAELSGNKVMRNVSIAREELAEKFLKQTDRYFKDSTINFRALNALLSAGLYFLVLQEPEKSSYGIDIQDPKDREEVKKVIRLIIQTAFQRAKN